MEKGLGKLLTNESFIDWLETKPGDELYNYYNFPRCAISTYFYESGYHDLMAGPDGVFNITKLDAIHNPERVANLPEGWDGAVRNPTDSKTLDRIPFRTYGNLLVKIRQLDTAKKEAAIAKQVEALKAIAPERQEAELELA